MELNLTRPIVFFDLETTGVDVTRDRIIELSYIKVYPDGREESDTLRINPEMHIAEEASRVNHITDDDVRDCPRFGDVANQLLSVFTECDLAGFNSNHFDIPLLVTEFGRVGIDFDLTGVKLVDVQIIYHKLEPRNLSAAYKFYCHKDLEGAHSANADTLATYEILKAQLDFYGASLKNDIDWLADFSCHRKYADQTGRLHYDEQGEIVFAFGKYKGKRVKEMLKKDPGYCGWVMQGDFPQDTKNVIARLKREI